METNNERRSFLKYLFSSFVFAVASIFSLRINKDEGFKVGKRIKSLGLSEAFGKCGSAYNCAGAGGKCGSAYNCPGGGGKCGSAYNCIGS